MPFSWIYGQIAELRNALFERGAFRSYALGAPTISVGNITVGGTGKTPLVALIAEFLAARGETVGILTRGYGRENPGERVLAADGERILADARRAGDEPFELAKKLAGKAVIVADRDRVAAAKWARENFAVTAFVLDDAFQHRRARRDLDIVCIDAANPFGNGKTLPFGRLREPPENLARAGLIVVTRADMAENLRDLKSRISKFNSSSPILTAENKITKLVGLREFLSDAPPATDARPPTADRCLAFCALGNPDNFFEQLRRENFNLAAARRFSDHYRYTQNDVAKLESEALETGAKILLTTAKDAVKLAELKFGLSCLVVESRMIFDDEKKLRRMIDAVLSLKPAI